MDMKTSTDEKMANMEEKIENLKGKFLSDSRRFWASTMKGNLCGRANCLLLVCGTRLIVQGGGDGILWADLLSTN